MNENWPGLSTLKTYSFFYYYYYYFQVAGYLRREGMSHGEGDESHDNLMQEIFHEEDKNKDGYISHDEFQGIKHGEL